MLQARFNLVTADPDRIADAVGYIKSEIRPAVESLHGSMGNVGYLVGGGIMIIGGLVEIAFGVNAEGKPLEENAAPLSKVDS